MKVIEVNSEKYVVKREMIISNWLMFAVVIIMLLVFKFSVVDFLYTPLWGDTQETTWLFFVYVLAGIILHELNHGVIAARYAKSGWKYIKFGVLWKYGAFYCHCGEPLMVWQYRRVALAPSIWAFVLIFVGVLIGSYDLMLASILMFVGGVGDFTILYKLRKAQKSELVFDYVDKPGCAIIEKQINITLNMEALTKTDLKFENQKNLYVGKVRDVYSIGDDLLAMVVSDRISAFDVVLSRGIPHKGEVLNQIAAKFLDATSDICPNWKIATPDPQVTVGYRCETYPVEMIVRGYLTGSSWRDYKNGAREICGVPIAEGMKEHQRFATPILTPTTKAELGLHDENISREEIISSCLVPKDEYEQLERYSLALFERGQQMAAERGLILVDTKYEFGKKDGEIYLIDEIHTPDSSRYFYREGYDERFAKDEQQRQLSKEFVREWLMDNNFQGREGDAMPELSDEFVKSVSERYIELYENIVGEKFTPAPTDNIEERIENNVKNMLSRLQ